MNTFHSTNSGSARKYQRVLSRLLEGPLNRFEAEHYPISDHTLPSTVSELKKRGVQIHAQLVRLPGYGSQGAHVAEYRLDEGSRARALQLLSQAGPSRGAP